MRVRIGILGFFLAGSTVLLLWPWISILQVAGGDAGDVRLCAFVSSGEEFTLSFIHSVNKRPVCDTLRAQGDHLVIVKSCFDAFGAGMPEASTEEGTLTVLPDSRLEWTVNRPVPEVIVRVGRVAEHTLGLKGRQFRLDGLAEPGKALVFRVRKSSIWNALGDECLWTR